MMENRAKTLLTLALVAIASAVILGYTYYRTDALIKGPVISINAPLTGTTHDEALVRIAGTADNIATITLNGRNIFIDEAGTIKEDVLLTYGYNILELSAHDRFGREATKTLELIYK